MSSRTQLVIQTRSDQKLKEGHEANFEDSDNDDFPTSDDEASVVGVEESDSHKDKIIDDDYVITDSESEATVKDDEKEPSTKEEEYNNDEEEKSIEEECKNAEEEDKEKYDDPSLQPPSSDEEDSLLFETWKSTPHQGMESFINELKSDLTSTEKEQIDDAIDRVLTILLPDHWTSAVGTVLACNSFQIHAYTRELGHVSWLPPFGLASLEVIKSFRSTCSQHL